MIASGVAAVLVIAALGLVALTRGSLDGDPITPRQDDPVAVDRNPPPPPTNPVPPAQGALGSETNPFGFGAPVPVTLDRPGQANGSVWNVYITADVLADNPLNAEPSPGFAFVGFDVELVLERAVGGSQSPGFLVAWEVLGGETLRAYQGRSLSDFVGCGFGVDEFDMSAEVEVGQAVTGRVCIPVPLADVDNENTRLSLDLGGDRVVFGDGPPD